MIEINQLAPDFTLARDGGGAITLSALRPDPVVLFFYPRDDTPGCTLEARAFTDLMPEFAAQKCQVIGISKDSIAMHDAFRDKYGLGVTLLSDADGRTCEAYGAWGKRTLKEREITGILRSTVLIDGAGRVVRHWTDVSPPGHAQVVLAELHAL